MKRIDKFKIKFVSSIVLLTLFVCGTNSAQTPRPVEHRMDTLPPMAQAQISAVIGEDDTTYHVLREKHGFRLNNVSHRLSAAFTPSGVRFDRAGQMWDLALAGYGYGNRLSKADDSVPHGSNNRVEYRRGAMTEWYVNGPLGIEQGFTLQRAPEPSDGGPLTLALVLSGELIASVDAGGRGLTLEKNGVAALRYSGLTAFDAQGRDLPAWLEVDDHQLLRVRVDDTGAQYPITIDPYVQATKLTTAKPCQFGGECDDASAYWNVGYSVAMSADGSTAVVTANSRAAYVFVRPGGIFGGWDSPLFIYYAAKLLPSDVAISFGESVAVNSNGTTIVVGAPSSYGSVSSAAYVFLKPASGWSNINPLFQTAKLTGTLAQNANLGFSVGVSADGTTIAAGAPLATFSRQYEGAVYIYRKPVNGWINSMETALLTLGVDGNPFGQDQLGHSVAISSDGNTVVAGSPSLLSFGYAAWVFTANNGIWGLASKDAKLIPSTSYQKFGATVSISGDGTTVAVSNCFELHTDCGGGVAFVYVKSGNSWYSSTPRTENARLTASDATTYDLLGRSLAISSDGGVIAATAPRGPNPIQQGSVYVFVRPAGGWATATETLKFTPPDVPLPISISANGSTILVGSPFATVGTNPGEGVAYVYLGSAASPTATVSPSSLSFGSQAVGTTSSPKTVSMTNTGTAPLYLTAVAAGGSFTSTQNCLSASPIAPGSSCSESVTFAPLSIGPATGTLTFTDNSGGVTGSTQQVQLQGDAVKAATATSITSVSLNPALVGEPITVGFGVVPQSANTLTPSGTVTVQASTGETCAASAASGSCVIVFSAAANRTLTAIYSGDSNFNASTSSAVPVSIVDFNVSVSPSSQTVAGRKATYVVTLTPVNGFTGTVSLNCSGGPANTSCVMSPTSVGLSGSAATAKATYTLPNNAVPGTYSVSFTGQFGGVTRTSTATLIVK